MSKRFTVEAVFKAIDKFTAPVSKMQNSISKFTRRTTANLKKIDRGLSSITQGFRRFAVGATIATALTGAAMADVIRTGAQFEQTIVNAGARFVGMTKAGKLNEEQLKLITEAAREVGRTTEFTATAAASALNSFAKEGRSVKDAITALPSIMNLATVAEVDLMTAVNIATKTMGAFNIEATDMDRVVNVLALSANRGNTTIVDMFEAIRQGGAIANQAGADIETTTALIAKLADAGVDASIAGTAIKRISLSLVAPRGEQGRVLRDLLGVETFDETKNKAREMIDVVKDIGIALEKIPKRDRLAVTDRLFGKIGLAGALVFIQQAKAVGKLRDQLKGASKHADGKGVAAEMAEIMRGTVLGQLKELNSAVESVKISIFELSKGAFGTLIKSATEWVRLNEKWIALKVGAAFRAIFSNADTIKKWGIAIAAGVTAFLALVVAVKSSLLVMTAFNLLMSANPIFLVIIAITSLIAVISTIVIWFDTWTEWLRNLSGWWKILGLAILAIMSPIAAFIAIVAIIIASWDELTKFFEDLFFEIFVLFDKWDKQVREFTRGLGDSIVSGIKDAFRIALNLLDEVKLKFLDAQALFASGEGLADIGRQMSVIEMQIKGRNAPENEGGAGGAGGRALVTPQQQLARTLEEKRTLEKTELTIKDETGRASFSGSGAAPSSIKLMQSGSF